MSKVMSRRAIAKMGRKGMLSHGLMKAKTTHLSEKSTSRMTHDVQELNKKVLQYINGQ